MTKTSQLIKKIYRIKILRKLNKWVKIKNKEFKRRKTDYNKWLVI